MKIIKGSWAMSKEHANRIRVEIRRALVQAAFALIMTSVPTKDETPTTPSSPFCLNYKPQDP